MKQAYPLQWPIAQRRTANPKDSNFSDHTLTVAKKELLRQIELMKGRSVIISSNIPVKQDGSPRADYERRIIKDYGVAVYFVYKEKQVCLACDKWNTIEDNLWALALSIDSMRGLERWGVSEVLDRSLSGFAELPMIATAIDIWTILDMQETKDKGAINARYRELAKIYQFIDEKMRDLNVARDQAMEQADH